MSNGYRENITGSWNLQALCSKDSLNFKTLGRSLKKKEKIAVKGSVAFAHSQSSALLWAENTGFYQCHSSINAEKSWQ